MKITNIKNLEIIRNKIINSNFISVDSKKINATCKIYKGDFYADSFNYFPITSNNETFLDLFSWSNKDKYNNFYSDNFFSNFTKNKKEFKVFKNITLLGSSVSNNYYRNLITFLPRIFFIPDKKINLAVHRHSSNKFRSFLKKICEKSKIKINKFVYLDDNFYFFENSIIPQFLTKKTSIQILNSLKQKKNNEKKIYITRKNSAYRQVVNESDLINELKKRNFEILETNEMSIENQINAFSNADVIISPTGSSLSNIVFCNKNTKIVEIKPKYDSNYENIFKYRYSEICQELNLKYISLEAESVEIKAINKKLIKFIDSQIIKKSNYYKNLIIKKNDFIRMLDNI